MARVETLVRGSTLVDQIERCFDRVTSPSMKVLRWFLALWSLATYVDLCFDAFPYLGITSATKRSGKTRTAEVSESCSAVPRNGLSRQRRPSCTEASRA